MSKGEYTGQSYCIKCKSFHWVGSSCLKKTILEGKANIDGERIAKLEQDMEEAKSVIDALSEENNELRSLINGVYELVYLYGPRSPAQVRWRRAWLDKAKDHGAGFDI